MSTSPDNNNISYGNNSFIKNEMPFIKNDINFIKTEMPYVGNPSISSDHSTSHINSLSKYIILKY